MNESSENGRPENELPEGDDRGPLKARTRLASERPPPETWLPARDLALRLFKPLESFLKIQASSGILLLAAAIVALAWANSPWKESYHALWHTPLRVGIAGFTFDRELHFWINDVLMVIFFFVVGLEIRRELHAGELSELKRASLPVAAAVGGMIAPAAIYTMLNFGTPAARGWGVPMATDIAFAVGVLALLGPRVPAALRVLLLALAIIDDIGAILVIAVFYSSGVQFSGLALAAGGVLGVILLQRFGTRHPMLYVIPGVVVWMGMLLAGVHPTIAGVVLGLLTPARSWFGEEGFMQEARAALEEFSSHEHRTSLHAHDLMQPLQRLELAAREAVPPVVRLEVMLNPWVAFGIMPLFALANAGVTLEGLDFAAPGALSIGLGVAIGLVVGKPLGIVGFSLLAARLGLSTLPRGVDWRGLMVVGMVGGIGFTMAIFIAHLASHNAEALGVAKLGVLIGSVVSGVIGLVAGVALLRLDQYGAPVTVDDAERSTEL
jgi:NhaA family Na+:H+ antiporter